MKFKIIAALFAAILCSLSSCLMPSALQDIKAEFRENQALEAERMAEALAFKAEIVEEVQEGTISETEAELRLADLHRQITAERAEAQRRWEELVDAKVTEAQVVTAEGLKSAGKLATGDIAGGVSGLGALLAYIYVKTKKDAVAQVNHERDQKYAPGGAQAGST